VLGAHLGDGWLWILVLILEWLFVPPDRRPLVARWGIAMLLAGGITTSMKFLWRRQRPVQIGGFYSQTYDQHSFPSGHATRMGTVVVFMPTLNPWWGWLALPIALWVAWSRVALGVHFLLDVVVGLALGMSISLIALAV
jgi:undecaprenyl-diphosphatase